MMTLLFILAGVTCILIWPWVYVLYVRSARTSALKQYAMLFGPVAMLFAGYMYYATQQTELSSEACGLSKLYEQWQ